MQRNSMQRIACMQNKRSAVQCSTPTPARLPVLPLLQVIAAPYMAQGDVLVSTNGGVSFSASGAAIGGYTW